MSRAWDLLKGKKSREVTGANIEGVGSSIFIQADNRGALKEWEMVSAAARNLAFMGGRPWPDSIRLYQATPSAGATAAIKPSTIFSDVDASGYLCVLYGASIEGSTDAIQLTLNLYDGSNTIALTARTAGTTSGAVPLDLGVQAGPVYFTEDVYITAVESGGASAAKVDLRVAIISRGGNPQ